MRGERSDEFREMRRALQTGVKRSEETKRKMSESAKRAHKKNPRTHSEETKQKIAKTLSEKKVGTEWYVFEDGSKVQTVDKSEPIFSSGLKHQRGMKWRDK
jgi:NUMOD3 motif.